jgi:hypothetical protein
MSIDTVRCCAIAAESVKIEKFDTEIISISTNSKTNQKVERTKYVTIGQADKIVPRLTYYPSGLASRGNLIFEVSLPKFYAGNNGDLLSDEDIKLAMARAVEFCQQYAGAYLPDWEEWSVSRLDGCYAWQVGKDIQNYISAVGALPVPTYKRMPYVDGDNRTEGNTWINGSRKINLYDKGLESKLPKFSGNLRLEIQNKSPQSLKSMAERHETIDRTAGSLISGAKGRAEVAGWLDRIGMPATLRAELDIFDEIVSSEKSTQAAAARVFFLQAYKKYGSGLRMKSWYSKETYNRQLRECKKKGWLLGLDETCQGRLLPGLVVSNEYL